MTADQDARDETATERFKREHGPAAAKVAAVLALPPLLLSIIAGMLVGLVLCVPGLALAMLVAVPHWLRQRRAP